MERITIGSWRRLKGLHIENTLPKGIASGGGGGGGAPDRDTYSAQNKFNHEDISINPSYFFYPQLCSFYISGSFP
jgi:hypothetical protein